MEIDRGMVTAIGADNVTIEMRRAKTGKRNRRKKRRRRSPSLRSLRNP
jgi:hypothetical protein